MGIKSPFLGFFIFFGIINFIVKIGIGSGVSAFRASFFSGIQLRGFYDFGRSGLDQIVDSGFGYFNLSAVVVSPEVEVKLGILYTILDQYMVIGIIDESEVGVGRINSGVGSGRFVVGNSVGMVSSFGYF